MKLVCKIVRTVMHKYKADLCIHQYWSWRLENNLSDVCKLRSTMSDYGKWLHDIYNM